MSGFPKGFPLRGSCLQSRLKRCPRYTSFVYSDRRSYPSGDTSSEPLRGPPSPQGNVINLRNRPVTAHRNTRRSGGNLPPQKMAWRLIVAATEVLTVVVNAFPITTFAKLTTLPSRGRLDTASARQIRIRQCPHNTKEAETDPVSIKEIRKDFRSEASPLGLLNSSFLIPHSTKGGRRRC